MNLQSGSKVRINVEEVEKMKHAMLDPWYQEVKALYHTTLTLKEQCDRWGNNSMKTKHWGLCESDSEFLIAIGFLVCIN